MPLIAVTSALAAVAVTAALTPHGLASSNDAIAAASRTAAEARPLLSAQISAEKVSVSALAAAASAAAEARAAAVAEAAAYRNSVPGETAALRARGVPCDVHAVACVSLSRQEAWLMHDGRVVYGPVRVATGRAGLPTPTGNFRVFYKVVDGWSNTYDAPMPYSIYFYEGDAFHEDPVTVRSHGCIHLSLTNAEYFYRFLHYGDLVEVRD
jgi:lipoprotein-anchoring transpeptidase ErfK/SrfK